MKIWIVDAFTSKPYSGNPAAVTIVDEFPSDERCLQIATEVNLSETAFIKPVSGDKFHLRWFAPMTEVKLCGHGTLASAHILYQERLVKNKPIIFESLSGLLSVYKNDNGLTLDFPLHPIGTALDISSFESALGVRIIAATRSLDDVILEIADEDNIQGLNVIPQRIVSLDCRALIVTAKSHSKYDFVSRFFAPRQGVDEDPVTGSAHCKLANYWRKKLNKNTFLAYQASKRGGELKLEIKDDRLHITGAAVTVLKGEWLAA